jgi:hypothetical protein
VKRLLLVSAAVLVVVAVAFAAYVLWFVRRAVTDRVEVTAQSSGWRNGTLDVELVVSGSATVVVTEIAVARPLAEAAGLMPPAGFALAPLELEAEEKGDTAAGEFVSSYNQEHVRYSGRVPLNSSKPTVIQLRASRPAATTGVMEFHYERKVGLGAELGRAKLIVEGPRP